MLFSLIHICTIFVSLIRKRHRDPSSRCQSSNREPLLWLFSGKVCEVLEMFDLNTSQGQIEVLSCVVAGLIIVVVLLIVVLRKQRRCCFASRGGPTSGGRRRTSHSSRQQGNHRPSELTRTASSAPNATFTTAGDLADFLNTVVDGMGNNNNNNKAASNPPVKAPKPQRHVVDRRETSSGAHHHSNYLSDLSLLTVQQQQQHSAEDLEAPLLQSETSHGRATPVHPPDEEPDEEAERHAQALLCAQTHQELTVERHREISSWVRSVPLPAANDHVGIVVGEAASDREEEPEEETEAVDIASQQA